MQSCHQQHSLIAVALIIHFEMIQCDHNLVHLFKNCYSCLTLFIHLNFGISFIMLQKKCLLGFQLDDV